MAEIPGLKLIVPTSVTNSGGSSSVSATGKVTFTSITTSLSVNGVFSATYDNYLLVVRFVGSASFVGARTRLRASGSDASGTNYTRQFLAASSTSVFAERTSSLTSAPSGLASSTAMSGYHHYIYGPALAQPTAFRSVTVVGDSGGYIQDEAVTHSLSTSYDGFSLIIDANNVTGTLTVYGLSQ